VFGIWRRKKVLVQEHWYVPLLDFRISTQEFYAAVEKEIADREVPDLEVDRVTFAEGGIFTPHRQYLRLRRERLVFDICSAPFGTSWFFSLRGSVIPRTLRLWELAFILGAVGSLFVLYWWNFGLFVGSFGIGASILALAAFLYFARKSQSLDDALLELPVVGVLYESFFRRETYYREDTRLMYLNIVGQIVKHQMEEFTRAAGVKTLDIKECRACRSKEPRDELTK
jgi:hypothetical protein